MRKEKNMDKGQMSVRVKVNSIIIKFLAEARKHNYKACVNSLIADLYNYSAGSKVNEDVLSFLRAEESVSILSTDDFDFLCQNARVAFDYLYNIIQDRLNYYQIPKELCSLILYTPHIFPQVSENEVIYTPFAGVSSFASVFPNQTFVGEEREQIVWAIGEVMNFFYKTNASISCEDSMQKSEKYNNIIAFPPIGLKGDMSINNIIQSLWNRLEDGGTMAIIVPTSFLFALSSASLRRKLVEEHAIHQVCLLPAKLLSTTSINLAVLTIEKFRAEKYYCEGKLLDSSKETYSVRFVDYSSFTRDNRKYGTMYKLDLEAIHDAEITNVINKDRNEKFATEINSNLLLENSEVNLNPRFHLNNEALLASVKDNEILVPLRDLVGAYDAPTVIGGSVNTYKIRVQDLSTTLLEGKKNFLNHELEVVKDFEFKVLGEANLLLVSRISDSLKPTIFEYVDGNQLAYSDNILPLKLTTDTVSVEYIQSQMVEDYFVQQVNAYRATVAAPYISTHHLLDCKIKVVTLKEQQERIVLLSRNKAAHDVVSRLDAENKELRDTQHSRYVALIRERRHAMGQVLGQLLPGLKTIINRIENEPLSRDTVISSFNGITAIEQLNLLYNYANRIDAMNKHLTDEYKYGKPEDVWVGKLIDEYTEKYPGENYSFEVIHPRVSNGMNPDGLESNVYFHQIRIAQRDFDQILDNIVANAVKYGFTDKDKTYCIRIMIESTTIGTQEAVRITIVNNGNPLPKNMDGEKVLTYGQSSGKGEGLGGWQLKNIVEHYGGNVKVEPNDGSETNGFTVAYVIDFPVINIENIDINEI